MATFTEAKQAQSQYLKAFAAAPEVVSVGLGYLDPDDTSKGAAVVVYTVKPLAKDAEARLSAPVAIAGRAAVPIRIEQSGEFLPSIARPGAESALADDEYVKRIRPVVAGYSVGTVDGSGTAGLIVISTDLTTLYVLSNNHVLNRDNSSGYSATLQPGAADLGRDPEDRIGYLFRFIPLQAADNYQDSAITMPTVQGLLDPRYGRNRITVPGHYVTFSANHEVFKAGRTTGDTSGRIDSINNQPTNVNYDTYGGLGSISFNESVIIKGDRAALPGDSGSVWLNSADNHAMAVTFAGPADGSYARAFPINWVMHSYGLLAAMPAGLVGTTKIEEFEDEAGLTPATPSKSQSPRVAVEPKL